MAFNKTERPEGAKMRRPGGMRRRKKVCVFCGLYKTDFEAVEE